MPLRNTVYMTMVSSCYSVECFCCNDSDAAHQRPSVCCNVIWLGASFLQSRVQVQSQRPAVQWLTFTTWPLQPPPILCQIDTAKLHWQHCDNDSSEHETPKRDFCASTDVWCVPNVLCEHSQGRPVRQCAAPQFWPSCCWSPGRSGLYAGRRPLQPRPALPLLYQLTAKSHRSQRPAVWSPQATYSFSEREGKRNDLCCLICQMWFMYTQVVSASQSKRVEIICCVDMTLNL